MNQVFSECTKYLNCKIIVFKFSFDIDIYNYSLFRSSSPNLVVINNFNTMLQKLKINMTQILDNETQTGCYLLHDTLIT